MLVFDFWKAYFHCQEVQNYLCLKCRYSHYPHCPHFANPLSSSFDTRKLVFDHLMLDGSKKETWRLSLRLGPLCGEDLDDRLSNFHAYVASAVQEILLYYIKRTGHTSMIGMLSTQSIAAGISDSAYYNIRQNHSLEVLSTLEIQPLQLIEPRSLIGESLRYRNLHH